MPAELSDDPSVIATAAHRPPSSSAWSSACRPLAAHTAKSRHSRARRPAAAEVQPAAARSSMYGSSRWRTNPSATPSERPGEEGAVPDQDAARKGALLKDYYGVGHDSLDNYTAMISGQAPNYELGQDCGLYEPFIQFGGENFDKWTKYHQLSGEGCVYPKYVKTVANQLTSQEPDLEGLQAGHGQHPHRDKTVNTTNGPACGHPKLGGGRPDRLDRAEDRQLRHPARPVRLLQVDHRQPGLLRLARAVAAAAGEGPEEALDDAELLVHHAEHLRRRPRLPVPGRHRRVACRGSNTFLKNWIPRIMKSPAYKAERPDRHQLRRVRRRRGRRSLLRRGRRPRLRRPVAPGHERARASTVPAAARSARSCCRSSSSRGTVSTDPTTTTRCCAASRTSSAAPPRRRPAAAGRSRSARTSTRKQ